MNFVSPSNATSIYSKKYEIIRIFEKSKIDDNIQNANNWFFSKNHHNLGLKNNNYPTAKQNVPGKYEKRCLEHLVVHSVGIPDQRYLKTRTTDINFSCGRVCHALCLSLYLFRIKSFILLSSHFFAQEFCEETQQISGKNFTWRKLDNHFNKVAHNSK